MGQVLTSNFVLAAGGRQDKPDGAGQRVTAWGWWERMSTPSHCPAPQSRSTVTPRPCTVALFCKAAP